MARRPKSDVSDVVRGLKQIVAQAAPGRVSIAPRSSEGSYEVVVDTQRGAAAYTGKTIEEAILGMLGTLDQPKGDDAAPAPHAFYRLSRIQRELVDQALRRHEADCMERAAEATLARDQAGALGLYAAAEAFRAASDVLQFQPGSGRRDETLSATGQGEASGKKRHGSESR